MIAGNWKMNLTRQESIDLVNGIHYGLKNPGNVDVVVAPVFTVLPVIAELMKDSFIGIAGQNISQHKNGAYTGEISADQLKDAGAEYVIIGHSERRQFFGDTNEIVHEKVKAALAAGLTPIFCIGETLAQREAGLVQAVLEEQIFKGLKDITDLRIVVAYEPVWAIGTGKTATPAQAEEAHAFVRTCLERLLGRNFAAQLRILYGGSVKASNAKELLSMPNIDGALVGGASLSPAEFISIVQRV